MVSALWSACTEGNLEVVHELLNEPSQVDLEVKDEAGNTPLIQAVKNDYVEIVKVLLEKGANPGNGSAEGMPVQFTTNPAILELFHNNTQGAPAFQMQMNGVPSQPNGYVQPNGDAKPVYYPPPPPGAYPYFHPGQPGPDGTAYFTPYPMPVPHLNGDGQPGGPGNLPPAEIARYIPCRYYPACRYGASCMFLHPQGPYMPGPGVPPPPGTFQYDPNMPPPQSFPPNMYPPPPPPMADMQQQQPHQQPVPFNPTSPVSPSAYPGVPMPVPVSMPPPQPPMNGPHTPPNGAYAYPPRPDMSYPPPPAINGAPAPFPTVEGQKASPNTDSPEFRQNQNGHVRRASGRRPSFGKPPCLFFPMGKCKNGNDCRFPHILSEGGGSGGRGPGARPLRPANGNVDGLNNKFGSMRFDGNTRPMNGRGGKMNGFRNDKRTPIFPKQKLPSADDFPVLAGSTTPPLRSPSLNGHMSLNGPTAAQVLQAPAPRKEPPSTRGPSPDSVTKDTPQTPPQEPIELKEAPSPGSMAVKKLPISFAAAATRPEVAKEQAVAA